MTDLAAVGEIVRICVAQLRPTAADIEGNVRKHHALLDLALSYDTQMVCFPELSLTGYETKLAKRLATNQDDPRLDTFQTLADSRPLCVAVGIPTVGRLGTRISVIVFQPGTSRVTYSKQLLHAERAAELGADIYLASVAKPTGGLTKAFSHYPAVARRHAMTVLMANCVGPCDDFVAVGQSAVWSSSGELLAKLDTEHEGIVLFDTSTREVAVHYLTAGDFTCAVLPDA